MTWLPRKTTLATMLTGLAALGLAACGTVPPAATSSPSPDVSSAAPSSSTSTSASPATDGGTCEYVASGDAAKPVNPPPTTGVPTSGMVTFSIKMTEGPLTVRMDRSLAPCTVNSFASLADQGYFNQTKCHRLTESGIFVLQCGDPTGTGSGGPGYQFADEVDGTETYGAGTVAMANAGPNTNGSQFFLVWADSQLPPKYTVFGQLDAASLDVVAGQIASQGRSTGGSSGDGKPVATAEIESVTQK